MGIKWQTSQRDLEGSAGLPAHPHRSITKERCVDTILKMFNKTLQVGKKFAKDKSRKLTESF